MPKSLDSGLRRKDRLWDGSEFTLNMKIIRTLSLFCWLAVYGTGSAEEYVPPVIDDEMRQALRQAMYGTKGFEDHIAAEVWLTDMSNRLKKTIPDADYRLELLRTIHAESVRAGLEPELVLAVIQVESNFDRFAISPTGARGLMQIMRKRTDANHAFLDKGIRSS